jgi:hypothetical protein
MRDSSMRDSSTINLRTPEVELLLGCCADPLAGQAAPRVLDLMGQSIDWDAVYRLAIRHRVAPMLYRFISANCASSDSARRVTEPVLDRLKREFNRNLLRGQYLTRELVRLMRALESSGIEALTYKGPALALMLYGDVAVRQFADLDVLVRSHEVGRAAQVVAGQGYSRATDYDISETAVIRECEDVFCNQDGLGMLDLHWRIMPRHFPFAPEPDSLFAGARRIAIGESAILTLSPADMMLVLCVHSTKHGWMNLSNLCDIAGMVRANRDVDWAEVLDKAGPIGAQRMVMLAFNLARELLGVEFPAPIPRMAQDDRRVIALTRRVIDQMFPQTFLRRADVVHLSEPWMVPLLSIERSGQRVRYCFDRALAPTNEESRFLPLPRFLLPLHYLTRPVRLILKLGKHLAARVTASARGGRGKV